MFCVTFPALAFSYLFRALNSSILLLSDICMFHLVHLMSLTLENIVEPPKIKQLVKQMINYILQSNNRSV